MTDCPDAPEPPCRGQRGLTPAEWAARAARRMADIARRANPDNPAIPARWPQRVETRGRKRKPERSQRRTYGGKQTNCRPMPVRCIDKDIVFPSLAAARDWLRAQGDYPKATHGNILLGCTMGYRIYGYRWARARAYEGRGLQ